MSLRKMLVILAVFHVVNAASASIDPNKLAYYEDYWSPSYHGQLLNYCFFKNSQCGMAVANQYCKELGYEQAVKAEISNNVGLTNYIDGCPQCKKTQCKGWNCNAFKVIRCKNTINYNPTYPYHFRKRDYVFPRFKHLRIDWCYNKGQGCGKKTADAFCKTMGYAQATDYTLDINVYASRELGNGKLCFGKTCQGFKKITCFR